jgi:hypothetical protein
MMKSSPAIRPRRMTSSSPISVTLAEERAISSIQDRRCARCAPSLWISRWRPKPWPPVDHKLSELAHAGRCHPADARRAARTSRSWSLAATEGEYSISTEKRAARRVFLCTPGVVRSPSSRMRGAVIAAYLKDTIVKWNELGL